MPYTPTPTNGDDVITDTPGNDGFIDALAGNDRISVTGGFDSVEGGVGRDRLIIDYRGATQSVSTQSVLTGSLATGYSSSINQGSNAFRVDFSGIEDFTVTGGSGNDNINTGDGDDVIDLGGGNDLARLAGGNDTAFFNAATDGADTVDLGDGSDLVNVSGITGQVRLTFTSAGVGNGNVLDTSTPNGDGLLNVRFQAENGSDGLTGPQSRFDDEGVTFVAAAGQTFDVRDTGGAARGDAFEVVVLGTAINDTLTAVQAARPYYFNAGMGDDMVTGGAANDFLVGGGGNDILSGGDGNDSFIGGAGNDLIIGGLGNDIATFNAAADGADTVDLNDGSDLVNVFGIAGQIRLTFTSAGVGNGNAFDSSVPNGDNLLNVRFQAENGSDGLTGPQSRFDDEGITFVAAAGQTFDVRDTGGAARGDQFEVVVLGTLGNDTLTAVQATRPYYFNAGMGDDNITGGTANDFLVGGGGNDILSGGDGNDSFIGGGGNDSITGGIGNDIAIFNAANDGADTADLGDGADVVNVSGIAGQIRLTFTSAGVGNGNALDTSVPNGDGLLNVRFQAENGSDGLTGPQSRFDDEGITFVAAAGQTFDVRDTGGAARGDQFEVVVLGTLGNDTLTAVQATRPYYFNAGMGDDNITGGTANDFLVGGGGNDILSGGDGNDSFIGGGGDDVILGEGGNDVLEGGVGADALRGGNGNDNMDGGGGADSMEGGLGNDTYIVDNVGDNAFDGAGGGTDYVLSYVSWTLEAGSEVETLSAADQNGIVAINLTGNEFGQDLIGNNGANTLDGRGGADRLIGIGGDDLYIVDNVGDSIIEGAGGGNDYALTYGSFTLEAGSEVETLSTADHGAMTAINLTGNGFGQDLIGNNGANRLDGGAGADRLIGVGGNDQFAFTTALGGGNIDQILDYAVGGDSILLDDAVFAGLAPGSLAAGAFNTGSVAQDADDRILYDAASGALYFDADGAGGAAAVQFASVSAGLAMTASEFTVI